MTTIKGLEVSFQRVTRAPSLADEVAAILRSHIAQGQFEPGAKLPTEAELASAFGVSRAVIREALSRLKHDGLVETIQGAGAFVPRTRRRGAFRLDLGEPNDLATLNRIYEFRQCVEGEIARLAAIRRTDTHLDSLRAAVAEMITAIQKGDDGVEADLHFHRTIAAATGNPLFEEFSSFLATPIETSIRAARSHSAKHRGLSQAAHREHLAILGAIEAGSPERARRAAIRHVLNAGKRLGLL